MNSENPNNSYWKYRYTRTKKMNEQMKGDYEKVLHNKGKE
jgi:hypothetical protein